MSSEIKCELILNKDTKLEVRVPKEGYFYPDEIEIWYVRGKDEKCVHKDSHRYGICDEVFNIIEKFKNADDSYRQYRNWRPHLIKSREFRGYDKEFADHELFERRKWSVILLAEGNNAKIIVVRVMRKHDIKHVIREEKSYIVERSAFEKWADTLYSLDLGVENFFSYLGSPDERKNASVLS